MIGAEMKNKEGKRIGSHVCVCVCVCVCMCVSCWQKAYSFGN